MITAVTQYRREDVQMSCRMQRVNRLEKAVCNICEMITDSKQTNKKRARSQHAADMACNLLNCNATSTFSYKF